MVQLKCKDLLQVHDWMPYFYYAHSYCPNLRLLTECLQVALNKMKNIQLFQTKCNLKKFYPVYELESNKFIGYMIEFIEYTKCGFKNTFQAEGISLQNTYRTFCSISMDKDILHCDNVYLTFMQELQTEKKRLKPSYNSGKIFTASFTYLGRIR